MPTERKITYKHDRHGSSLLAQANSRYSPFHRPLKKTRREPPPQEVTQNYSTYESTEEGSEESQDDEELVSESTDVQLMEDPELLDNDESSSEHTDVDSNSGEDQELSSESTDVDSEEESELTDNEESSTEPTDVDSEEEEPQSAYPAEIMGHIKRNSLNWCKPSFDFGVPASRYPRDVIRLLKRLEKATRNYSTFFEAGLRKEVKRQYPQYDFSPSLVADTEKRAPSINREFLDHAKVLHNETIIRSQNDNSGERDCYKTVSTALSGYQKDNRNLEGVVYDSFFIDKEYLPINTAAGPELSSMKIDLVLRFMANKEPFRAPLRGLRDIEIPKLGPFVRSPNDALIAVPVEVKDNVGDSSLAEYQSCMAASALLEARHRWAVWRGHQFDYKKNPPLVITLIVIKHVWYFYIVYLGEPNKDPLSENPLPETDRDSDVNLEPEDAHDSKNDVHFSPHMGGIELPRIVVGPIVAGDMTTLPRTFALVRFLDVLRAWVYTEWADAILAEIKAPQRGRNPRN